MSRVSLKPSGCTDALMHPLQILYETLYLYIYRFVCDLLCSVSTTGIPLNQLESGNLGPFYSVHLAWETIQCYYLDG